MASGTILQPPYRGFKTSWTELDLDMNGTGVFETYASGYEPKYCIIGDMCYITGAIKAKQDLNYTDGPFTIAYLPEEARPITKPFYFLGFATGTRHFTVEIATLGRLKFDHFGAGNVENILSTYLLVFTAIYPLI